VVNIRKRLAFTLKDVAYYPHSVFMYFLNSGNKHPFFAKQLKKIDLYNGEGIYSL